MFSRNKANFWLLQLSLFLVLLSSCANINSDLILLPSPVTKSSGPDLAKGAVIWFPGYSVWEKTFAKNSLRVPYVFADMSRKGWDIFHATLPDRGRRQFDYADARSAIDVVAKLKATGYKKVVLAGQSLGAWLLLTAGKNESGADGIVMFAPAAFGPYNTSNAVELYKALNEWTKTPTIFVEMDKDIFNPVQDRAKRVESILSERKVPHLVIDKPLELAGHASANFWRFSYMYENCFENFLNASTGGTSSVCEPVKNTSLDTRWMSSETELIQAGAKPQPIQMLPSRLIGKDFFWYSGNADWRIRIQSDHKLSIDYLPISTADYLRNIQLDWREQGNDEICFDLPTSPKSQTLCWKIYLSDDGFTHFVGTNGVIIGRFH